MSEATHVRRVRGYYHTFESIVGYRFMTKGVKHFGYHDDPDHPSSIAQAQERQDEVVAQTLKLPSGAKVLECGCGEGSAANYIAKNFGLSVQGIDLLPRNITRAQHSAKKLQTTAQFQVGDYMNLPFESATFDGIYAMETLVHAPDAHRLFKEIRRVLKPGGVLVFCEYSMTPREKMSSKNREVMSKVNTYSFMPTLEEFITGNFPTLLKEAGFKQITVDDITPNFMPTLKYFYERARRPNTLFKRLHLEKRFINAYSAAEIYPEQIAGNELIRYNLVRAIAA